MGRRYQKVYDCSFDEWGGKVQGIQDPSWLVKTFVTPQGGGYYKCRSLGGTGGENQEPIYGRHIELWDDNNFKDHL